MNKKYWDEQARSYEASIFSVLQHDRRKLVAGRIAEYGSPRKSASDLGCGIGHFLPLLSRHFKRVLAVDISTTCLDRARKRCGALGNVDYVRMDLARKEARLPAVHFALSVNGLLTPSLTKRHALLDFFSRHLTRGGHLVLVVPSLESAMLCDFRLIEWNVRLGLPPAASARAGFKNRRRSDTPRLNQGLVEIDNVPTKHFLREELMVLLDARGLKVLEMSKLEYPWSTEFKSPPRWMKEPYPWDWLVLARK